MHNEIISEIINVRSQNNQGVRKRALPKNHRTHTERYQQQQQQQQKSQNLLSVLPKTHRKNCAIKTNSQKLTQSATKKSGNAHSTRYLKITKFTENTTKKLWNTQSTLSENRLKLLTQGSGKKSENL